MVRVQFFERFNAAAAPASSLSGVDHLPRLIMALLHAVPRFGEPENYPGSGSRSSQILEDLRKLQLLRR